ncbi:hypothetical protein EV426DRAFT_706499 [Tirmania nivea]|nr:hypothetical protein EV426DRAFT_706499 [Tirmania nivea]
MRLEDGNALAFDPLKSFCGNNFDMEFDNSPCGGLGLQHFVHSIGIWIEGEAAVEMAKDGRTVMWVKGHSGVEGNERAYRKAKEVAWVDRRMLRPDIVTPAGIRQAFPMGRPSKQARWNREALRGLTADDPLCGLCEEGIAQNAAHLLPSPGVADGKGREWEQIWEDPEWGEKLAEALRGIPFVLVTNLTTPPYPESGPHWHPGQLEGRLQERLSSHNKVSSQGARRQQQGAISGPGGKISAPVRQGELQSTRPPTHTWLYTNRGPFSSWLRSIGKTDSPACLRCGCPKEDRYHITFDYFHRQQQQRELISTLRT